MSAARSIFEQYEIAGQQLREARYKARTCADPATRNEYLSECGAHQHTMYVLMLLLKGIAEDSE